MLNPGLKVLTEVGSRGEQAMKSCGWGLSTEVGEGCLGQPHCQRNLIL